MHTYQIAKTISVGRKSTLVTVKVGNKTVSRHIVNGRGTHPDDTIPKQHRTLTTTFADALRVIKGLDQAVELAKASKDPKVIRPAAGLRGHHRTEARQR